MEISSDQSSPRIKAGVGPVGLLLADAKAREPEHAKTIYCIFFMKYEYIISALYLYTVLVSPFASAREY
jgi:hypothetical protein